jgi:hypothetical protein
MNSYPSIDKLEVTLETGQGVAIILEGETEDDDPWYFQQWFGGLAKEVAFFPQDGWFQVTQAVAELRRRVPGIPVYGIIDRDFCDDSALDTDFETAGILRTPRYALENYLLEPEGWAAVFRLMVRNPADSRGWNEPAQVRGFIEDAYRNCLPLSAHNSIVQSVTAQQANSAGFQARKYLDDCQSFSPRNCDAVLASLRDWGTRLGSADDLAERFEQKLQSLQQSSFAEWETQVHGRYVLKDVHSRFPKRPFPLKDYLSLYMDRYSVPPPDLDSLVERILEHAQKARAHRG